MASKGFVPDNKRDHRYFHHVYEGKRTGIFTYTSHGSTYKTYGDELLGKMKRQLYLKTPAQLRDLVTCPISAEEYIGIVKANGYDLG